MNSPAFNPGQLLELSGSYWKTCVLHAAVKLDIFTALGKQRLTGDAAALKVGADKGALHMLLNALSAMGLLVKTGETYANTPAGLSFLSKDSPQYIGYMILHHHHLMSSWTRLEEAVKKGGPLRTRDAQHEEEERENFLMGMFNIAMGVAPRLTKSIDLAGRSRLLDLGGGPGTYAIHFCLNNPLLKATVGDLPATRPFAVKTIKQFGLTDRIDFKEVDYLQDDISGTYDVVWISHILHAEGLTVCQKIIGKAVSVLNSGGLILIHDFILNDTMDSPLFPALFSLNMLLGTDHGRSYSEKQIVDMLTGAGVKQIKRIPFQSPAESGIISGIV